MHINGRIIDHMKLTKIHTRYSNNKVKTERTWNCASIVEMFWGLWTDESTTICKERKCRNLFVRESLVPWCVDYSTHHSLASSKNVFVTKTHNFKEIS
jgi:hypothetical protein